MNDNSFYSINRLVEFGMGIAMAQQMIQVMNQSMKQMYVPGSMQTIHILQSQTLYVAINGQSIGPLTESDFARMVTKKEVTKDTLGWMPGMLAWQRIEQIPAMLKIVALAPPPIPKQ